MASVRNSLSVHVLVALLASYCSNSLGAAEADPKSACRAEDVIKSLAGRPPDRLDFLGERLETGAFRCEAYFTFNVYGEVWNRLNALAKTLKDVEGICLINSLQRLPKVNGLQIDYVMTAAGQFRLTAVSDGLDEAPKKLSQKLKAALTRLEQVRDADDDTIINNFVRKNCPEANYPPEIE